MRGGRWQEKMARERGTARRENGRAQAFHKRRLPRVSERRTCQSRSAKKGCLRIWLAPRSPWPRRLAGSFSKSLERRSLAVSLKKSGYLGSWQSKWGGGGTTESTVFPWRPVAGWLADTHRLERLLLDFLLGRISARRRAKGHFPGSEEEGELKLSNKGQRWAQRVSSSRPLPFPSAVPCEELVNHHAQAEPVCVCVILFVALDDLGRHVSDSAAAVMAGREVRTRRCSRRDKTKKKKQKQPIFL